MLVQPHELRVHLVKYHLQFYFETLVRVYHLLHNDVVRSNDILLMSLLELLHLLFVDIYGSCVATNRGVDGRWKFLYERRLI